MPEERIVPHQAATAGAGSSGRFAAPRNPRGTKYRWCRGRESNSQRLLAQRILSPSRLPFRHLGIGSSDVFARPPPAAAAISWNRVRTAWRLLRRLPVERRARTDGGFSNERRSIGYRYGRDKARGTCWRRDQCTRDRGQGTGHGVTAREPVRRGDSSEPHRAESAAAAGGIFGPRA